MCGIVGAVWWNLERSIDRGVLRRMREAIAHRGPDDTGEWLAPFPDEAGATSGIAMAHQRLAVLDRDGGHQPLANEDGTIYVVFNGEIYNHRELRKELESRGHRFRTRCDTEVLVHLYEDYGVAFPEKLNGMFAIAMADQRVGRLILVRDRLGEKPLVYRAEPGRIAFASEMKSLRMIPGTTPELDVEAVDLFLTYQYVPHPATIDTKIRKLAPGEELVLERNDDGTFRTRLFRYWNPDFATEVSDRSESDWVERVRETVSDAVRRRLESDVPLGTFLSGGVDSTIIAGLVRRLSGERIRTFSIGFPESDYDETRYAREVAGFLDTDHTELRVNPDALAILPRLVYHYDEPFADSSAIPTWYVSEITRRHVTVALTGDGGDELFGGYRRYRAAQLAGLFDRWPGSVRGIVRKICAMAQRLPVDRSSRNRGRQTLRFLEMLGLPPLERYLQWIAIFHENQRRELYRPDFYEKIIAAESRIGNTEADRNPVALLEMATKWEKRDAVSTVSCADIQTYLPCDILTKVDVASMAHALETRAPLLDHHVVELAVAMPTSLKIRQGRGKYLFRKAFAEFLPESVRRRTKMGFGVPLEHWFRGALRPLLENILLAPRTLERPFFRPEQVRRLVTEHLECRFDHAYRLWALLLFELWYRRWMESDEIGELK
ncbi:MAG: asparagine synthase (glutamine-hydrolyzing) [Planctomycetia bacterium]|nr:asparagine synthase (glutamine-hydrolyzing) [Planctomycetia bacterium]